MILVPAPYRGPTFDVLDHGHVALVDVMGNDAAVVQAARVSYGGGTKSLRDDEKLIRYLMRNRHMTPFEMVRFKFHVKLPIFCARQWIRHRTGSFNEVSARYSILPSAFYIPDVDQMRVQSSQNRQGRGIQLSGEHLRLARDLLERNSEEVYARYEALLDAGLARELARLVLPVNIYTEWYWSVDLRNLFHFLDLRLDERAQWEMQEYARALVELVQPLVPVCMAAWKGFGKHD